MSIAPLSQPDTIAAPLVHRQSPARPMGLADRRRFEWIMTLLCSWFAGGVVLDGWAHNHIASLETFFTVWHAVLYSGYMATALFLLGTWMRARDPDAAWEQGLPDGYAPSLIGAVIFAFAGVGDMIWHIMFGIERSVDALLSPTHLLLATGGILMITGPLRAAWRRPPEQGLRLNLPMLVSLTLALSLCTFFTQFADPFVVPWAAQNFWQVGNDYVLQALGVGSILLQAALLSGFVLLAIRRGPLPLGSLTLVFTVNAVMMSFMQDHFFLIPVATATGLLADLLSRTLRPSEARPAALRTVAFAVPALMYLLYFLALQLNGGIWWTIHMWLGSAVLAGIVGLFLSYLVVPPRLVATQQDPVVISADPRPSHEG